MTSIRLYKNHFDGAIIYQQNLIDVKNTEYIISVIEI